MPPEIPLSYSPVTPKTPLLSRISPKSRFKQILHHKYCRAAGGGRMKLTKSKLIPVLVFVLCGASVFRFLNISMISTSPARLPPIYKHQHGCSSVSSVCGKNTSQPSPKPPSHGRLMSMEESGLAEKEMRFLLEFFSSRVPCNLLIFGVKHQYSNITNLNAGGVTVFLQDNHRIASTTDQPTENTQVFRIMYNTVASEAYQLLKVARENPNCSPKIRLAKASKCNLALSNLPQKVYDTPWDVVVVDGPRGDAPESPGRMASIYTAGMLARRGNTTHVIVHDVERMIEKWFSREYLCEENLVSSKGRFQHFQIQGMTNSTKFCAS